MNQARRMQDLEAKYAELLRMEQAAKDRDDWTAANALALEAAQVERTLAALEGDTEEEETMDHTYYAVVQLGHAIFGTGATPEAALADAQQWTDEPITLTPRHERVDGSMVLARCTARLHQYVQMHGTPTAWDDRTDVLDLLVDA